MKEFNKEFNFDAARYAELVSQEKKGLLTYPNEESLELSNLRGLVYEQFSFNNRHKYLEFVEDCLAGEILLGGSVFVFGDLKEEIALQLRNFEENSQEVLKDFHLNPKARDFSKVETSIFGLLEFCNDPTCGFTEEEILISFAKIREFILACDES